MSDGNWKSRCAMEQLVAMFATTMEKETGTLGEREARALKLANQLVERWLEAELARIARRYEDEVLVDGIRYGRHSEGARRYHSLCGTVAVSRGVYRQVGVHNGPTVVPLELEAGLVEGATPALAASVVQGFASMPLRQYEQEMAVAHRTIPSRSTLERIGKRIGARLRDQLPVLEPVVRAREAIPAGARSISIGLDRTTVPMSEETGKKPRPARGAFRARPNPVVVAYRMAYVATVAVHDRNGHELSCVRLAATAEEGPSILIERLTAEVEHLLSRRRHLPVVVVQDGAPELWTLVDECLENLGVTPALRLIDRYHLDARLAEVSDAVAPTPAKAKRLFAHWRRCLDRTDSTLSRICSRLARAIYGADETALPWCTEPLALEGERAGIVEKHLGYFMNCRGRASYATARKRGFPVGSGITEGACKSVVAARFKRSGQRWFEPGASACPLVRSLQLNGRLAPAIERVIESGQMSTN